VKSAYLSTAGRNPGRHHRRLLTGLALVVLAAASAGCSNTSSSDVKLAYFDHRLRHPVMISEEPEVFEIPVGMNGPAMSPEIETAIADFARRYRIEGTGAVTIQVPTASANEIAAASTGRAAHYALVRAGVPHNHISVAPYHVGDHAKVAAVRLTYLRVKAVTPRCGVWPESTTTDYRNSQYHNFGCASQQNLTAMVSNPADLLQPQPMAPASGARRAKVINDYGSGDETKSAMELEESGVGD
jgi:pilus assembly protein CpaD